jgi:ATP-dependent Clp protease protease subunit
MAKRVNPINIEEKIDSGLLQNSTNFLVGDIDYESVKKIIKWIVFENTLTTRTPLTLYINSHGGSLLDAFALIEVMKKSKKPIRTIGIGSVVSAAFMIFAAGTKGERMISKTASVMCHQFSDGYSGKYHDIKAVAKENELVNERMVNLLKEFTGLETRTIKSKLLPPSDVWFTADELLELGVADKFF